MNRCLMRRRRERGATTALLAGGSGPGCPARWPRPALCPEPRRQPAGGPLSAGGSPGAADGGR